MTEFSERVWLRDLLAMPSKTDGPGRITKPERAVAFALALCVHWPVLDGAFPGVVKLAGWTGYGRDVCGEALSALRAKGWLRLVAPPNYATGNAAEYGLTWPDWHHRQTGEKPPDATGEYDEVETLCIVCRERPRSPGRPVCGECG